MDSSFGPLDAFAFIVFAVLIFVAVIIVVSLGKLPGDLARKWAHPQAAAINVMSWVGLATGGVLWPIALIWAFTQSYGSSTVKEDRQTRGGAEPDLVAVQDAALPKTSGAMEIRT